MTPSKPRVLVLFGGQSPEHAVSCVTAAGVLNAIDTNAFDPVPVGITQEGQWTIPETDPRDYTFQANGPLPNVIPSESTVQLNSGVNGSSDTTTELLEIFPNGFFRSLGQVDAVFPLLHGPFGEDGTVQGLLELAGLPYVGAGVLASAMGMDKHYMKMAFSAVGLNVGPYCVITASQWRDDSQGCLDSIQGLELPLFVKPARGGSSVGITRVDEWHQLEDAIYAAQVHDPKIVVEEGINGREIECGVLGGRHGAPARSSLCGEIVVQNDSTAHQFYDFSSKYTDAEGSELSCPAHLPDAVSEEIRRQAVIAFEALDAEGISRADFFYRPDGGIVINEVNTMPGFTPISMYPRMWEATGIAYKSLISELLHLALERPTGLR